MIKKEKDGLRYYQFKSLRASGIFHGVFTRLGGVSPAPWASLNTGGTVGDEQEHVETNLDLILKMTGTTNKNLRQVCQIHSSNVLVVDNQREGMVKGDAMVTNREGLYLLMRFADCVPLLFFDPITKAIGIAHAGWQGTVKEVSLEVVRKMEIQYHSKPEDLLVGIGPSIGPDHYLVRDDVLQEIRNAFPGNWSDLVTSTPDGVKLNLWKANEISLRKAGVNAIEHANICTGCNTNEWYSHRVETGNTGRFAAVIGITAI